MADSMETAFPGVAPADHPGLNRGNPPPRTLSWTSTAVVDSVLPLRQPEMTSSSLVDGPAHARVHSLAAAARSSAGALRGKGRAVCPGVSPTGSAVKKARRRAPPMAPLSRHTRPASPSARPGPAPSPHLGQAPRRAGARALKAHAPDVAPPVRPLQDGAGDPFDAWMRTYVELQRSGPGSPTDVKNGAKELRTASPTSPLDSDDASSATTPLHNDAEAPAYIKPSDILAERPGSAPPVEAAVAAQVAIPASLCGVLSMECPAPQPVGMPDDDMFFDQLLQQL